MHCLGLSGALVFSAFRPPNLQTAEPVLSAASEPSSAIPSTASSGFEAVEFEKLRIAREVGKLGIDDKDFTEESEKLKKKLAEASVLATLAPSLPSDLRNFLSAPPSEVQKTDAYYKQLKAVLNKLSPESPYLSGTGRDNVDPKLAADLLREAADFDQDDGLSQTILNQWGAKEGGARDDARRSQQLDSAIRTLAAERKRLEWNYKMSFRTNALTGEVGGGATDADRVHLQEQIDEVKQQISELEAERNTLMARTSVPLRKLEFQQLITQLAVQQRYLHALIACGFYRTVFTGGEMSIQKEAFPAGGNPSESRAETEPGRPAQSSSPVAREEMFLPATITGLESFLRNRISDAKKDREALEKMLSSRQLSSAESIAGKMISTAKYQPELQTVSTESRGKLQSFYQTVRQISEAVDSKNYNEIETLSEKLSEECSDIGTQDLRAFAKANRQKALFWVSQAEIAARGGDGRSAQVLLESAQRRAPNDPEVQASIDRVQTAVATGGKRKDELEQIVQRQDYAQAYERMSELIPLASASGGEELKKAYLDLLEKEKTIRAALERSSSFEQLGAFPEAWLALNEVQVPLDRDSRLQKKKNELTSECADFVESYGKGRKYEAQGQVALGLTWYLKALALSHGNSDVKAKIKSLGELLVEVDTNQPKP